MKTSLNPYTIVGPKQVIPVSLYSSTILNKNTSILYFYRLLVMTLTERHCKSLFCFHLIPATSSVGG